MEVDMSSAGSQFEDFARDCVRLARQADSSELREKLFDMAREWMRAAMDGQPDQPRRTSARPPSLARADEVIE
jgi:hypothetical protein